MRIPIGEQDKGVVYKSVYRYNNSNPTYVFIPEYWEWSYEYHCHLNKPPRIMTFAEFKEEFPYISKWSRSNYRTKKIK